MPDKLEEPENLTADKSKKDLSIKISFKTQEDLENAKVQIEQVLESYENFNISVSGGEL